MKGNNLKFATSGQAAVIGMAIAALLLLGCPAQGATPNSPNPVTAPTNTAAKTETKLTPKQIAELKTKAAKGDAEAQFGLAQAYSRGDGVPEDEGESFKWTTRAAENGHAKAAYELAVAYRYGERFGVTTNAPLALRWLTAAADRGLVEAQSELASSYSDGGPPGTLSWGTPKDLVEAANWYRKAAEQGDVYASAMLGAIHSSGEGVPTNKVEAAKWYRKAADQGDRVAQSSLGEMYLHGEGVPTNTTEGLRLIELAVASLEAKLKALEKYTNRVLDTVRGVWGPELSKQCALLGDYYYYGTMVPGSITNALHWYEKAALASESYNSRRAQFQLGYLHATETKNFTEAVKWYRKCAEGGDTTAQFSLAIRYYYGNGVERDLKEAAKWYRKAAEAGGADAQDSLAEMYRDGEGVPRDDGEAAKWFRKAAEQGHATGQNNLGSAYAEGRGVPQDYVEAHKWFNLAAAQGSPYGMKNRDGITRSMTPGQIAEAQRRSSAFVPQQSSPSGSNVRWEDFKPAHQQPRATGTAFFITADGYLLTCAHVVIPPEPKSADGLLDARPVTRIEVTVAGKTLAAKLVKVDKANDVAVLQVAGTFKPLPLAPSRTAKLGEAICTLGFPNTDIQGVEPKFTTGEINGLAGIQDDPRHFQISVAVQPGNSGGPLVDSSGNVIGLVSARLADIATLKITGSLPQNVNYALKSSFITAFLETLPDVSSKLKTPRPTRARPLAEIADEVKSSVVLVTVY